jgi:hypothetical protein
MRLALIPFSLVATFAGSPTKMVSDYIALVLLTVIFALVVYGVMVAYGV